MVGAAGFEPALFLLPKQVPWAKLGDAPLRFYDSIVARQKGLRQIEQGGYRIDPILVAFARVGNDIAIDVDDIPPEFLLLIVEYVDLIFVTIDATSQICESGSGVSGVFVAFAPIGDHVPIPMGRPPASLLLSVLIKSDRIGRATEYVFPVHDVLLCSPYYTTNGVPDRA